MPRCRADWYDEDRSTWRETRLEATWSGARTGHRLADKERIILGERIAQTCMDVLIRDEWIRLERATGIIATKSGILAVAEKGGQVTTDDGTYCMCGGFIRSRENEEGSGLLH